MATTGSKMNTVFAYTVVYVKDVAKSTAFYSKAFGYNIRRIDDSNRWGELESGQTTIAFTPVHQHETDDLTGAVKTPSSGRERQPVEVCFAYSDVDAAYKVSIIYNNFLFFLVVNSCLVPCGFSLVTS
ncbi:unnamed protein product [Prunus armeniaca]